jgi:diguanylate cyclase (GGDEF)-like protein
MSLLALGVASALAQGPAVPPQGAFASQAAPAPAMPWPPLLQELHAASLDDPELTLREVQRRQKRGNADPATAFWLALAAARLQIMLEMDTDAAASLGEARRRLEAMAVPDPAMPGWLSAIELRHRATTDVSTAAVQALSAERTRLRPEPGSVLACEWDATESWLLNELDSHDEAWRAVQALERCSELTGWPHFRAQALADRAYLLAVIGVLGLPSDAAAGPVAGAVVADRVTQLFDEAYHIVGPGPGRFVRSLIAYAAGNTLRRLGRTDEAARHLERALAASRTLGDRAGIAAALSALAAVEGERGRHAQALRFLDEAEPLQRQLTVGNSSRLISLYTQRLQSLVSLGRRAEIDGAIARALAINGQGVQPSIREGLARAVAGAHAAAGRHAQAYDWMVQAQALAVQTRSQAHGAQVLRLQTLYDNSRREAELAALRYAEEASRLSLQAQQATARMLWAALVAAVALVAGVAVVGWRQWSRRRELAELALRDTLTGLANRRAIEAYARAQFEQARRLKLPFTVAMIDLDHFKAVNDLHGHATGDALLRAFAQAVPALLRSPDRLGRWGGEEFLLVLPGTAHHELPGLFMRLRSAFAAAEVPSLPQPHGCSFTMGGAEAGRDGSHFEALVEAADRRLYEAKAAGRDRLG